MGDDGVEPIGVSGNPVGHVAAERSAHRRGAVGVDARVRARRIGRGHQIGVRRDAPCAPAALDEVLSVAGRQRRDPAATPRNRARPAATGSTASATRSSCPVARRGSTAAAAPAHHPSGSASHDRTGAVGRGRVNSVRVPGSRGGSTTRQLRDRAVGIDAHRVRRRGIGTAQREEHAAGRGDARRCRRSRRRSAG